MLSDFEKWCSGKGLLNELNTDLNKSLIAKEENIEWSILKNINWKSNHILKVMIIFYVACKNSHLIYMHILAKEKCDITITSRKRGIENKHSSFTSC